MKFRVQGFRVWVLRSSLSISLSMGPFPVDIGVRLVVYYSSNIVPNTEPTSIIM